MPLTDYEVGKNPKLLGAVIRPPNSELPSQLFWDPILSHSAKLECSIHKIPLKRTGHWAKEKGRDKVRRLKDVSSECFLISALYVCQKCKHRKLYLAHNEALMKQLGPTIEAPFVLFRKSGATTDLINHINGGIRNGML